MADSTGKAQFDTISVTSSGILPVVAEFCAPNTFSPAVSVKFYIDIQNTLGTTATTLTSSLNPSSYGQPVTFTAHVTSANGIPTGSVSFSEGGTPLGTAPVDTNGNASLTTSNLKANNLATGQSQEVIAAYTPTGTFAASSATLFQIVNGLPTVTSLTISPTTGTAATTFTMTATVAAASS